jgi:hypothetical protein
MKKNEFDLTVDERVALTSLLGQHAKGFNFFVYREVWKLIDQIEISNEQEKKMIGFKAMPNGGFKWDDKTYTKRIEISDKMIETIELIIQSMNDKDGFMLQLGRGYINLVDKLGLKIKESKKNG